MNSMSDWNGDGVCVDVSEGSGGMLVVVSVVVVALGWGKDVFVAGTEVSV